MNFLLTKGASISTTAHGYKECVPNKVKINGLLLVVVHYGHDSSIHPLHYLPIVSLYPTLCIASTSGRGSRTTPRDSIKVLYTPLAGTGYYPYLQLVSCKSTVVPEYVIVAGSKHKRAICCIYETFRHCSTAIWHSRLRVTALPGSSLNPFMAQQVEVSLCRVVDALTMCTTYVQSCQI